jgi:DNA-binding transcriptional LysR family regulator
MRQITSLESRFGRRIFERGRDGYYPTPFGAELISVTRQVALDFQEFFLTRGSAERTIAGNIMIAAPSCLTKLITTSLADLRMQYPDLWYSYSSIEDNPEFELDGKPDIVLAPSTHLVDGYSAQKLTAVKASLFASVGYVETHGMPKTLKELRNHTYVSGCSETLQDSAETWMRKHTPARSVIFRANGYFALYSAIASGIGIGLLPTKIGLSDPDMIQIRELSPKFSRDIWVFARNEHARGRKAEIFLEALRKRL